MLCQPAVTSSGPPFTVTTSGPAPLTAALADALQAQWQLGFPRTPDGVDQLIGPRAVAKSSAEGVLAAASHATLA